VRAVADVRGVGFERSWRRARRASSGLASLVGLGDYASTYLALGSGSTRAPIRPIDELKERIAL
jgi:hypothetical protein